MVKKCFGTYANSDSPSHAADQCTVWAYADIFIFSTLKKLEGHIAFVLFICPSVCPFVTLFL